MGEFELIERYFERRGQWALPDDRISAGRGRITLGIGDDCALLHCAPGCELAVSTDMLVAGRHFFSDVDPEALGCKSLAVNLSDLAAMGARPLAFTLALALPAIDETWLDGFSRGLHALAEEHGCALIGGDTTRGPLTISLTIFGELPSGSAVYRSGARVGDTVWVSGTLGDAALALRILRGQLADPDGQLAAVRVALERPVPRVALGSALRARASAMIDLSDGLAGDLPHILQRSDVGARIDVDALPLSPSLQDRPRALALDCALGGGDDYELCFTAPPASRADILEEAARLRVQVTAIGEIVAAPGVSFVDRDGHPYDPGAGSTRGYDHFA